MSVLQFSRVQSSLLQSEFFRASSSLIFLRSLVVAYVFFLVFIFPSNFPSITYFRRKFLRKMWPIQLAFFHFTVFRTFLTSLATCNTSFFTRSVHPSPVPHFKTSKVFLIYFPMCPRLSTIQTYAQNEEFRYHYPEIYAQVLQGLSWLGLPEILSPPKSLQLSAGMVPKIGHDTL